MSVPGARAAAVRETIAELCESPPAAADLIETVAARVRSVVPYDRGTWMVTDPDTLLPTSILPVVLQLDAELRPRPATQPGRHQLERSLVVAGADGPGPDGRQHGGRDA